MGNNNHYGPVILSIETKTIAYFSTIEPKNLVIFIHGFTGLSLETWNEFPNFIENENEFKNCDVIFYGYESVKTQASSAAMELYKFLKKANELKIHSYRSKKYFKKFEYEKIILVAHSLGAILTRLSLIRAKEQKMGWLNRCRMILFGPAHCGARIQNLILNSKIGIFKIILLFASYNKPIIDDLKSDSYLIQNLHKKTEEYIKNHDGIFTKSFEVIWAREDKVVINSQFFLDPDPQIFVKTHSELCKPNSNFLSPLKIVKSAL